MGSPSSNAPYRLVLIQCGARKESSPRLARDLYTGPIFRAMRAYAVASRYPWAILSAKHHVVQPTDTLAPYDVYLGALHKQARAVWAKKCLVQLLQMAPPRSQIYLMAGSSYTSPLDQMLNKAGYSVVVPMRGLPMGYMMQWLKRHKGLPGHVRPQGEC